MLQAKEVPDLVATGKLLPSPHFLSPPLTPLSSPLPFFGSPTLHLLFWPPSLCGALEDAASTTAFPI